MAIGSEIPDQESDGFVRDKFEGLVEGDGGLVCVPGTDLGASGAAARQFESVGLAEPSSGAGDDRYAIVESDVAHRSSSPGSDPT